LKGEIMARLTKKSFQKMSASDIGKMKSPELRELIRGARQLYMSQDKVFKRYESSVYSPSREKMQDFYEEYGKKSPSRMNMGEMRREAFRLQEFFEAETSTVPGARRVQSEQDKRIFGTTKSGRAKKRMNLEQRKKFWSAYNEFKNLKNETYIRNMGSNTVMQTLAEIMMESASAYDVDFSIELFNNLEIRLEERRQYEEWEMSNYDGDDELLSGKRPY